MKQNESRRIYKRCSRCRKIKLINNFFPIKSGRQKNYYQGYCKECHYEYKKIYRKLHPDKSKFIYLRHYQLYPWNISYRAARERCLNQKHKAYKYYGSRNIKFLMSRNDFKELWFRDKAYLLKHPTIDRINNNGNYEFNNCRFIEKSENTKRAQSKMEV